MAQSTEKKYAEEIEDLNRKKAATVSRVAALDRERDEAKEMLDDLEKSRKAAVFSALDSIKKRYFSRLLGDKGIKVKTPKVSGVMEATLGKITTIPKIVNRNMNEIEIQPILKNYAYVRILYDTMANEYFYEAIEPKLLEEEAELLDVLKEILVENLELLDDAERVQKENYLRRATDGLARQEHEQRPQSLAPGEDAVPHRLVDLGRPVPRLRQPVLQGGIHPLVPLGHDPGKIRFSHGPVPRSRD